MEKIVRDLDALDDYDPTVVEASLTRFLVENFVSFTTAGDEDTFRR